MKILSTSVACLALLAGSNTALAKEANPFSGFRADAQIGLDLASTTEINRETYFIDNSSEEYLDIDHGIPAISYGLGIGYDHALNDKVIVGLETSLTFTDAYDGGFEGYLADNFHGDDMQLRREFEIAARAGYVVNPSVLVYAKAGYAIAGMSFDIEENIDAGADYIYHGRQNRSRGGLRLGAGVEAKLTKGAYTKFEYRYTDYNDWNSFQKYGDENYGYIDDATFKVHRHQAVLAIGYRF